MLPAQYRMRRSTDFSATVRHGRRAVQPDLVIHARRVTISASDEESRGPRVGLIVAKSVGSAVQRHQVARKLRHVVRELLDELDPSEQLVIRARPGSSSAESVGLRAQLQAALRSVHRSGSAAR
ncbi:MAG: ribonuclease P protein component [Mycobacterium sp.]